MKQAIDRSWMSSLVFAMTLILASAAGASDGVIEINQACAENTGCVAGDSAGFPVFIGATGTARSYILTSDLVPSNSGSVIFIDGDQVSLDMNGFSILCGPSSTFGIRYGFPESRLRVSNGTIRACNSGGIGGGPPGASSRVEGLTVIGAIGGGIDVGPDSIVENCSVSASGSADVGSSPTFSGIKLGTNGIARDNNVSGAVIGIQAGAGSLISGNVARNNTDGLDGTSSTIINNTSTNNSDDGIVANTGSSVVGNTLRDNRNGLDLGADTSYRGNSITGSTTAAIEAGTGVNQGQNTCIGPGAFSLCP